MANEKYPRMPHLPWSPGATRDDQRLEDVEHFLGREIVVTEKIDGANLCLTRGDVFARTHSGRRGGVIVASPPIPSLPLLC